MKNNLHLCALLRRSLLAVPAGLGLPGLVIAALVVGTAGPDVLEGTPEADTLDGKAGADTMMGLGGHDIYIVGELNDEVIEGANEGTDTIRASVTYTLPIYVEKLTLIGTDAINGTGNGLANVITGNAANNILNGKAGADQLRGGAGNDILNGGPGRDFLSGQSGADRYHFATPLDVGRADVIAFFEWSLDKFLLDDAIFTALVPGPLPSSAFRRCGTPVTADSRILCGSFDEVTTEIKYDPDGTGPSPAVPFAQMPSFGGRVARYLNHTHFIVK
jgi:hypothetical protein